MKYHADPIIDAAIGKGASWDELLAIDREQQFQKMLVLGMLMETLGIVKFCIGVRFPDLPIPKALDSIEGFKALREVLQVVITSDDPKAVLKAINYKASPKNGAAKRAH